MSDNSEHCCILKSMLVVSVGRSAKPALNWQRSLIFFVRRQFQQFMGIDVDISKNRYTVSTYHIESFNEIFKFLIYRNTVLVASNWHDSYRQLNDACIPPEYFITHTSKAKCDILKLSEHF